MDSVKADNEGELTSTMDNVISVPSKVEKSDTSSDATPTSSTDANIRPTASHIGEYALENYSELFSKVANAVSALDDPISSTSSDSLDQLKSKMDKGDSASVSVHRVSTDNEADLLDITNITNNEKITEDVEDLVHDLESLLGESTDSFSIPSNSKSGVKETSGQSSGHSSKDTPLPQENAIDAVEGVLHELGPLSGNVIIDNLPVNAENESKETIVEDNLTVCSTVEKIEESKINPTTSKETAVAEQVSDIDNSLPIEAVVSETIGEVEAEIDVDNDKRNSVNLIVIDKVLSNNEVCEGDICIQDQDISHSEPKDIENAESTTNCETKSEEVTSSEDDPNQKTEVNEGNVQAGADDESGVTGSVDDKVNKVENEMESQLENINKETNSDGMTSEITKKDEVEGCEVGNLVEDGAAGTVNKEIANDNNSAEDLVAEIVDVEEDHARTKSEVLVVPPKTVKESVLSTESKHENDTRQQEVIESTSYDKNGATDKHTKTLLSEITKQKSNEVETEHSKIAINITSSIVDEKDANSVTNVETVTDETKNPEKQQSKLEFIDSVTERPEATKVHNEIPIDVTSDCEIAKTIMPSEIFNDIGKCKNSDSVQQQQNEETEVSESLNKHSEKVVETEADAGDSSGSSTKVPLVEEEPKGVLELMNEKEKTDKVEPTQEFHISPEVEEDINENDSPEVTENDKFEAVDNNSSSVCETKESHSIIISDTEDESPVVITQSETTKICHDNLEQPMEETLTEITDEADKLVEIANKGKEGDESQVSKKTTVETSDITAAEANYVEEIKMKEPTETKPNEIPIEIEENERSLTDCEIPAPENSQNVREEGKDISDFKEAPTETENQQTVDEELIKIDQVIELSREARNQDTESPLTLELDENMEDSEVRFPENNQPSSIVEAKPVSIPDGKSCAIDENNSGTTEEVKPVSLEEDKPVSPKEDKPVSPENNILVNPGEDKRIRSEHGSTITQEEESVITEEDKLARTEEDESVNLEDDNQDRSKDNILVKPEEGKSVIMVEEEKSVLSEDKSVTTQDASIKTEEEPVRPEDDKTVISEEEKKAITEEDKLSGNEEGELKKGEGVKILVKPDASTLAEISNLMEEIEKVTDAAELSVEIDSEKEIRHQVGETDEMSQEPIEIHSSTNETETNVAKVVPANNETIEQEESSSSVVDPVIRIIESNDSVVEVNVESSVAAGQEIPMETSEEKTNDLKCRNSPLNESSDISDTTEQKEAVESTVDPQEEIMESVTEEITPTEVERDSEASEAIEQDETAFAIASLEGIDMANNTPSLIEKEKQDMEALRQTVENMTEAAEKVIIQMDDEKKQNSLVVSVPAEDSVSSEIVSETVGVIETQDTENTNETIANNVDVRLKTSESVEVIETNTNNEDAVVDSVKEDMNEISETEKIENEIVQSIKEDINEVPDTVSMDEAESKNEKEIAESAKEQINDVSETVEMNEKAVKEDNIENFETSEGPETDKQIENEHIDSVKEEISGTVQVFEDDAKSGKEVVEPVKEDTSEISETAQMTEAATKISEKVIESVKEDIDEISKTVDVTETDTRIDNEVSESVEEDINEISDSVEMMETDTKDDNEIIESTKGGINESAQTIEITLTDTMNSKEGVILSETVEMTVANPKTHNDVFGSVKEKINEKAEPVDVSEDDTKTDNDVCESVKENINEISENVELTDADTKTNNEVCESVNEDDNETSATVEVSETNTKVDYEGCESVKKDISQMSERVEMSEANIKTDNELCESAKEDINEISENAEVSEADTKTDNEVCESVKEDINQISETVEISEADTKTDDEISEPVEENINEISETVEISEIDTKTDEEVCKSAKGGISETVEVSEADTKTDNEVCKSPKEGIIERSGTVEVTEAVTKTDDEVCKSAKECVNEISETVEVCEADTKTDNETCESAKEDINEMSETVGISETDTNTDNEVCKSAKEDINEISETVEVSEADTKTDNEVCESPKEDIIERSETVEVTEADTKADVEFCESAKEDINKISETVEVSEADTKTDNEACEPAKEDINEISGSVEVTEADTKDDNEVCKSAKKEINEISETVEVSEADTKTDNEVCESPKEDMIERSETVEVTEADTKTDDEACESAKGDINEISGSVEVTEADTKTDNEIFESAKEDSNDIEPHAVVESSEIIENNVKTEEVFPDSSQSVSDNEFVKDDKDNQGKSKVNERSRRHKKSSESKLDKLNVSVDIPDKEKAYSPKITFKPIKVPDEEVSTTSNTEAEQSKGSLKMTITKQSDKMHSILKPCDVEQSPESVQEQEEPVPKLKIKSKSAEQLVQKMSTRSSRQIHQAANASQRSSSPRITIKPVVKPEPLSPLKIKIGKEEGTKKHSPKLNVKNLQKQDEEPKEIIQSPRKVSIKPIIKPPEEEEQAPKITIKAILKPESEKETSNTKLSIKPIKKPDEEENDTNKSSPKITIKPIVKPPEPIVLKINKGNLPAKDSRKREHLQEDDKAEKLAKITLKLPKEGGHPHIVQPESETTQKRPHEEANHLEKNKKQKTDIEPSISTRSKQKDSVSGEADAEIKKNNPPEPLSESNDNPKSKQHISDNPGHSLRGKHKDSNSNSPVEAKRMKLKESKQKDSPDTKKAEAANTETMASSPMVTAEDSGGSTHLNPGPEILHVSTPDVSRSNPGSETSTPVIATPQPRKRGRPRKIPLEVRQDIKEPETPPSQIKTSETPPTPTTSESGRPKRSCRGQSALDTLGLKPRKPRANKGGRGGGRAGAGETRAIPMKPEKEPKLSQAKLKLMQKAISEAGTINVISVGSADDKSVDIEDLLPQSHVEKRIDIPKKDSPCTAADNPVEAVSASLRVQKDDETSLKAESAISEGNKIFETSELKKVKDSVENNPEVEDAGNVSREYKETVSVLKDDNLDGSSVRGKSSTKLEIEDNHFHEKESVTVESTTTLIDADDASLTNVGEEILDDEPAHSEESNNPTSKSNPGDSNPSSSVEVGVPSSSTSPPQETSEAMLISEPIPHDASLPKSFCTREDSSLLVPESSTLILSAVSSTTGPSEIVMMDEETRMSADTSSRAQTPAKQVMPMDIVEESQSSVQSTATTESGKASSSRTNKAPRLEVQEPEGSVISPDQLAEYYWNGNGPFMLQEQVAHFLGIKSFKRKYPGIKRRMLEMQERDFIRESGLVSEHMCDLGLTAVNSADILDIMYSDFQDKYEEYCKHQRDRQAKELINKQKALSLAASQEKSKADLTENARQSAAQWNANFNKVRREQRRACMDLQTYTVHYPKGRIKQFSKAKMGNYPVSLVPGQFTDFFKEFTPTEINNFPLSTMCYETIDYIRPEVSSDSGSDGSDSDSDSSSSSSGSDSSSSSGVEDCKLCKHSPKKVVASPVSK